MPYTALQIANLGLGKIAASKIKRLDPPVTPLERHIADGYPMWRRSEIGKYRWTFAEEEGIQLTSTATMTYATDRPYQYLLDNRIIRPLRDRSTEWVKKGRFLYSAYNTLIISAMVDKPEAEFDEYFVNVLACRVGFESAEYVTQSNTKVVNIDTQYKEAVADAARADAFTQDAIGISDNDETFPYLTARWADL